MAKDFSTYSTKPNDQGVAEWVASEIKQKITAGDLTQGDRLPSERHLSEALAVSRVSVRAGLQKLKALGLVSSVHGGGTRVIAPSPQLDAPLDGILLENLSNAKDLIELRAAQIVWAARKAAQNRSQDDLARLQAIAQDMHNRADHPGEVNALDLKFQACLGVASGSAVFLHLIGVIDDALTSALLEMDTNRALTDDDAAFFILNASRCIETLMAGDADSLAAHVEAHCLYRRDMMLGQ